MAKWDAEVLAQFFFTCRCEQLCKCPSQEPIQKREWWLHCKWDAEVLAQWKIAGVNSSITRAI